MIQYNESKDINLDRVNIREIWDAIRNADKITLPTLIGNSDALLRKRDVPEGMEDRMSVNGRGMNRLLFLTSNNNYVERVHCMWCSKEHDSKNSEGKPIDLKQRHHEGEIINVYLTAGCYHDLRCMYAATLKEGDIKYIELMKSMLYFLETDITPAPSRELHTSFCGYLDGESFQSDYISHQEIHVCNERNESLDEIDVVETWKTIQNDDTATIPITSNGSEILLRKRAIPEELEDKVYANGIGMNRLLFLTSNNNYSERVHCMWCSKEHDLKDSNPKLICLKQGHFEGDIINIYLTTGYYHDLRCMHAAVLKEVNVKYVELLKSISCFLKTDVTPAPPRELHIRFGGCLDDENFQSDYRCYSEIHIYNEQDEIIERSDNVFSSNMTTKFVSPSLDE